MPPKPRAKNKDMWMPAVEPKWQLVEVTDGTKTVIAVDWIPSRLELKRKAMLDELGDSIKLRIERIDK